MGTTTNNLGQRLRKILSANPFKRRAEDLWDSRKMIGTDLIKSRPGSLTLSYEPLQDEGAADRMFLRLRRFLYRQIAMGARNTELPVLREAGKINPGRAYFYLQPLNQEGWLFERSGTGWSICQAHKIQGSGTFMRSYDTWDIVTLHQPKQGGGTHRVSSQRLGADLVSFAVYEQKLIENLKIS